MRSHFALLGAAQLGWGLLSPVPSPTDTAANEVDLYGITPKPTTLALLHPGLAKRQNGQSLIGYALPDNTCGFVSGSLGASKTCDNTQQCAAVQIGTIATLGCCDTADDSCTWFGNCVNYSQYYSGTACGQACRQDINTVKCTNINEPYCFPYMVPDISIGFFSCDSVSQTVFASFLSTYIGEADGRSWSPLYDSSSASSKFQTSSIGTIDVFNTITDGGSQSTKTVSKVPTSTVVTNGGGTTGGGTIGKTKTKKTPTGGIVGGVIGGLALIGAIIAGFIAKQMKKKKDTPPVAAPVATNMGNAPPAGPDIRQSMYGQQPPPQGQYPQGPYPPQQQYPQQQQYDPKLASENNPGFFAAAKYDQSPYLNKDGPQIAEQSVPVTPLPTTSPAPPYISPVQQGHESWNHNQTPISPAQSPPPQMMQQGPYQAPPQQQVQPQELAGGQYQPPQFQPQGPAPVELGTTFSTPQRNAEGRPVYEAA